MLEMPLSIKRDTGQKIWWREKGHPASISQALHVELVHRQTSAFQTIEVYQHAMLGRILVLDGIIQTTQADEHIYHEMLAHVPLVGKPIAPAAKRPIEVLIIGGGDGGLLREVLKHDLVARAVMVEIDAAVVEVAQEYLGIHGDYTDPRVELRFEDGIAYLATAVERRQTFDVILVDSSDDGSGPNEVLFSGQFYRNVSSALKSGGIMARHLGVPAYQGAIFAAGIRRIKEVFASFNLFRAAVPTYTGGDMAFVAAGNDGFECRNPQRPFTGVYYNHAIHRAAFALPTSWQQLIGN